MARTSFLSRRAGRNPRCDKGKNLSLLIRTPPTEISLMGELAIPKSCTSFDTRGCNIEVCTSYRSDTSYISYICSFNPEEQPWIQSFVGEQPCSHSGTAPPSLPERTISPSWIRQHEHDPDSRPTLNSSNHVAAAVWIWFNQLQLSLVIFSCPIEWDSHWSRHPQNLVRWSPRRVWGVELSPNGCTKLALV